MLSLPDYQKKKTILVVEDDDDFQWLIMKMLAGLEDDGVEIIGATDGRTAIETMLHSPPDLVILDLDLPDMSGWEVFLAMRQAPSSARVPVIILSNEGTRLDRSFGLLVAQVHDYLVKPCLPSRLRQSVTSALAGYSGL